MAKNTTKTEATPEKSAFTQPDILPTKVGTAYFNKKKLIIGGIILTTIVIFGAGLYYFTQYQHVQKLLKNPVLASELEQEAIISKIGKLTSLPANEQPSIAKVTDVTKLQDQEFFKNAKNGDIVLIYTKAKRIVLYDPVANQVVQADTFATSDTAVQGAATKASAPQQAANQPVSVAIYNGTTVAGLAKKTEVALQGKMKNVTVVAEANATKQDYTQTTVIDLNGNNAAAAAQLASVLSGTVGTLPSGEVKPPNADILVILGEVVQPTPSTAPTP